MRCIFCKENSSASVSIEHIIPEALGNTEHILPPGVVCDTCNNYFARKIEGPLLSSLGFKNLRSRQLAPNKRGTIPTQTGLFPAARIPIELDSNAQSPSVFASNGSDDKAFVDYLRTAKRGTFYIPISVRADERVLSRFLGKVAIEAIAHRTLEVENWNKDIIDNSQLDFLRSYVRRNTGETWPFHSRRIYDENSLFEDGYQVLHEYDMLMTAEGELYLVLCIFGKEYAINVGGPLLDGYKKWLSQNKNRSPLYV